MGDRSIQIGLIVFPLVSGFMMITANFVPACEWLFQEMAKLSYYN